jgi:hypothetical protein
VPDLHGIASFDCANLDILRMVLMASCSTGYGRGELFNTDGGMEMKLWLIWQRENQRYDTFDEAVVCSESEESAKLIRPDGDTIWDGRSWASSPEFVQCKLIGIALPEYKEGDIICASFNAG